MDQIRRTCKRRTKKCITRFCRGLADARRMGRAFRHRDGGSARLWHTGHRLQPCSVPEVVRHGINGFLCHSVEQAVAAVSRLKEIDREAVRSDCEKRFSATAIVDAYEQLYFQLVGSDHQ